MIEKEEGVVGERSRRRWRRGRGSGGEAEDSKQCVSVSEGQTAAVSSFSCCPSELASELLSLHLQRRSRPLTAAVIAGLLICPLMTAMLLFHKSCDSDT